MIYNMKNLNTIVRGHNKVSNRVTNRPSKKNTVTIPDMDIVYKNESCKMCTECLSSCTKCNVKY